MFLRLVLSNRHPFTPSALPDFLATMGVSDFRQTPPSSSLLRLVQRCAPAGAPSDGSPWLPRILFVKLDATSDPGLSVDTRPIASVRLLPAGCENPSARSNDAVFGTPRLQGQHHLLPLHLAAFVPTHQAPCYQDTCKARYQACGSQLPGPGLHPLEYAALPGRNPTYGSSVAIQGRLLASGLRSWTRRTKGQPTQARA